MAAGFRRLWAGLAARWRRTRPEKLPLIIVNDEVWEALYGRPRMLSQRMQLGQYTDGRPILWDGHPAATPHTMRAFSPDTQARMEQLLAGLDESMRRRATRGKSIIARRAPEETGEEHGDQG